MTRLLFVSLLMLLSPFSSAIRHKTVEIFPPETRNVCLDAYEMLLRCEANYSKCESLKPTSPDCFHHFSVCVSDRKISIDSNCETFVAFFVKKVTPGLDEARDAVSRLIKGCGYSDATVEGTSELELVELAIGAMKQKNCSEAQNVFEMELIAVDSKSSAKIPIPSNRYHCAWQQGNIGKIFSRVSMRSCDRYAESLNHCCAEHLNCYIEQDGQGKCDERFVKCNSGVLKRVDRSCQHSCKDFVKKTEKIMNQTSSSYDWILEKRIITNNYQEFDGNLHRGFTDLSINLPFFYVDVHGLSSGISFDLIVAKSLHDVLKVGWSRRMIIDSCALSAEICHRKETVEMCLRKLSVCLNETPEKSADLEREVENFDKEITKFIAEQQNRITIEQVKDACSESSFSHVFWIILEIAGVVFANWLSNRYFTPNRMTPVISENVPLTPINGASGQ